MQLLEKPESLRSRSLLALGAKASPDAVDVRETRSDVGLLEFRKARNNWVLYRGGVAVPTKSKDVSDLINTLSRPDLVTSFPDPSQREALGLKTPSLIVKVGSDSLEVVETKKLPEKQEKTAKPAFKKGAEANPVAVLNFGNFTNQKTTVAVERIWGKVSTIVEVSRDVYDLLTRSPLEFYDLRLDPV